MNNFCFKQGHRDANHPRPKIWRLSFFTPPRPPHLFVISKDPSPPHRQIDPAPSGSDLGHYMKRVSMGLTDRRKTAKNLVDSRKN